MQVQINCKGAGTLPISELKQFQGELKTITPENLEKLKRSIKKHGFAAPIFVWDNEGAKNILDGHQRLKALTEMEKAGAEIPELPVVYIYANNEKDAKEKLLYITSQYGEFTTDGFTEFSKDLDLDFEQFNIELPREEDEKVTADVEFSEELFEEHNYVVLYFDNNMDWLNAQTFFDLQTKSSKRSNGKEWSRGIGRVVNGAFYIRKMQQ